MKEDTAVDRFIETFGVVNAIRLLGYAYQLDTRGEDWLREMISRQQLAKIKKAFKDARVPFGQDVIEWSPRGLGLGKKLSKHRDALVERQARDRDRKALRGRSTA
jgi:hypothetical protein